METTDVWSCALCLWSYLCVPPVSTLHSFWFLVFCWSRPLLSLCGTDGQIHYILFLSDWSPFRRLHVQMWCVSLFFLCLRLLVVLVSVVRLVLAAEVVVLLSARKRGHKYSSGRSSAPQKVVSSSHSLTPSNTTFSQLEPVKCKGCLMDW